MAARKNPRRFLHFVNRTVPDDDPIAYRWSTRPIVYPAFPAFIEGRVEVDGWLEISRSASAMSGEYSIDGGGVRVNDADGLIRAALADPSTQWFLRRSGIFLVISDAALEASLSPGRPLLVGQCTDLQLRDGRKAEAQFEDLLSVYLDRTYPQYTLGNAYPYRFTDQPDDVTEDLNTEDPGLQIPAAMRDQVLPIYYGPFVDTTEDPQGLCPAFFMGYTFLTAGTGSVDEPSPEVAAIMEGQGLNNGSGWGGWGELVVGAGELGIPNGYAHNLSADDPKTALISEDRYGVEFLVPGKPGWPFATDYVMREGFRLTVIYARGPALYSHLTGGPQIRVDVCGWPDADGVMIDQAAYVYQDFLTQHVLAHNGAGYTGGPLADLPVFPPTVYVDLAMFWTSKIQAFQAVTAARLGTAKGYLCSLSLTTPTTLREILRTFHVTFDCFSAKNGAGQLYLFAIDDLADPEAGVAIREWTHLLTLPAPRIAWDEIVNEIDFTVGWIPAHDTPRTITRTLRDQASIDALGGDVRKVRGGINVGGGVRKQGIRSLTYTADDPTALDVIGRRLMRLRSAPRYQPIPVKTDGVDREIGEQVRISHRDGIGAPGVGYALRPMVLLKSSHLGDLVTLEALDVGHLLPAAGRWAGDAVPDWEDATEADRVTYGFWTADDGTIPPDGARGSEWR
jgi:hypothetical protein